MVCADKQSRRRGRGQLLSLAIEPLERLRVCKRQPLVAPDLEDTDYAISGAAGIGGNQRPGLAAMLLRIERGGISQVLAESTDGIARHEATTALRAPIGRIVLTPNPHGRGVSIQVEGREPSETLTAKLERVKGIEPSS